MFGNLFGSKKKKTGKRHRRSHRSTQENSGQQRPASSQQHLEKFIVEEVVLSGDVRKSTGGGPVYKARPKWIATAKISAVWISLWLMLVLASLFTRSLWPPDETRALAVAWDMWTQGRFIVPLLDGALATYPSPLFLWSTHLGWWAFGVSDWWPRLVPALFALGSVFLCAPLARLLWPGREDVARYAPGMLLGGFAWIFFATSALPDIIPVFSVLLAFYALAWIWRTRDLRVWLLLGLAFGLGMLSQGAMIYLYVLPAALLAPLWITDGPKPNWQYWYADIFKAVTMGCAIFGLWAAQLFAKLGAKSLASVLFVPMKTQSLALFAPETAWWWYLFLLPLMGMPWSIWPLTWMRFWHIRREHLNPAIVLCMTWAVPAIFVLSLFTLRQPQWLLPVVPAFTLVVTYLLLDDDLVSHSHDTIFSSMTLPVVVLGGVLAVLPGLPRVDFLPEQLWSISPFVGIAVILVGMALSWLPVAEIKTRIINMISMVVALSAIVLLGVGWQFESVNTVNDVATVLSRVQQQQRPLAQVGSHAGEFDFAARLASPMPALAAEQIDAWLMENPQGLVLTYTREWQPAKESGLALAFEVPYSGQAVRLWEKKPEPVSAPVTDDAAGAVVQ
jgi:4-amino-4-deoxy-L-arabinose transferase-like glycosyltransferase